MNKDRSRKDFSRMYEELTDPGKQDERAQAEQRRKRIEDKRIDTGYA